MLISLRFLDLIAVVDLSDPVYESADFASFPSCEQWAAKYGSAPYGKLDRNNDGKDDRIQGYLPSLAGSRATIVVDSESAFSRATCDATSGTIQPSSDTGSEAFDGSNADTSE